MPNHKILLLSKTHKPEDSINLTKEILKKLSTRFGLKLDFENTTPTQSNRLGINQVESISRSFDVIIIGGISSLESENSNNFGNNLQTIQNLKSKLRLNSKVTTLINLQDSSKIMVFSDVYSGQNDGKPNELREDGNIAIDTSLITKQTISKVFESLIDTQYSRESGDNSTTKVLVLTNNASKKSSELWHSVGKNFEENHIATNLDLEYLGINEFFGDIDAIMSKFTRIVCDSNISDIICSYLTSKNNILINNQVHSEFGNLFFGSILPSHCKLASNELMNMISSCVPMLNYLGEIDASKSLLSSITKISNKLSLSNSDQPAKTTYPDNSQKSSQKEKIDESKSEDESDHELELESKQVIDQKISSKNSQDSKFKSNTSKKESQKTLPKSSKPSTQDSKILSNKEICDQIISLIG